MAIAVEMPKMSDTMEEGVLVSWLVEEGDEVAAGDVIAQVETDKATMDLEVYDDGVLLKKMVAEGAGVPIGGLIAVLGKEGEDIDELLAKYANGSKKEEEPKVETEVEPQVSGDGAAAEPEESVMVHANGDVKASPLARKMAGEAGLDIRTVRGTGPDGRIVKRDIEAALGGAAPMKAPAKAPAAPPVPRPATAEPPVFKGEEFEKVPVSQMRKTIARRLAESKFTAPHFYLTMQIDMENAVAARKSINEIAEGRGEGKISFNDMITKACALALKMHPSVNSSWVESENAIYRHNRVNVAIAVAIDEGLVTPVIRDADLKSLSQIAAETKDLASRARDRKLQPEDWEGSTFTTSNLGMFGIEKFTAIINPPNACILAIGGIMDEPVVKEGAVVPGKRMRVTLSCDHRVVDGATGSAFLGDVKRFLEDPVRMFV
ncbi:MAG: pyruvate dehydrogenase complex dihydrolipoamide acetyltransferase [Rubricoccaceae bacterium]|nr:pyruvate dehydrogenase complex dihydrolipoamide acetyltransferase [Rubricoccaceae bacterium]